MMAYQVILTRDGKDNVLYAALTQEELEFVSLWPLCPSDVIRVAPCAQEPTA